MTQADNPSASAVACLATSIPGLVGAGGAPPVATLQSLTATKYGGCSDLYNVASLNCFCYGSRNRPHDSRLCRRWSKSDRKNAGSDGRISRGGVAYMDRKATPKC